MKCKRCSNELSGKQLSYCSLRCSKLHLKSLWRKRSKDKLRAYNRKYRSQGLRPLNKQRKFKVLEKNNFECKRCGTNENLNVHHIKPLRYGGTHDFVMVLCFKCHMEWEQRMIGYWIPLPSSKGTPPFYKNDEFKPYFHQGSANGGVGK
jgi:5-methylcytosine-specific restriction endonuclease McrA